jgi:hypothetical protein
MPAPAPAPKTRVAANGQVHAAAAPQAQAQAIADPDAAGAIQDVFLTPRVLDRRAFEDYAESLKALIRDASGESHTLSQTAADVRVLREQLASAAADAQKRLDAATRAIAAVEQRAADVRAGEPAVAGDPHPAQATGRKGSSKAKAAEAAAILAGGAAGPGAISTELLRALEARLLARLEQEVEARIEARVEARVHELAQSVIGPMVAQGVRDAVGHAALAASTAPAAPASAAVDPELIERLATDAATSAAGAAVVAALEERLPELTERAAAALVQPLGDRAAGFERSIEAAARKFTADTTEHAARLSADAKGAIESARAECEAAVRQITTGASLRVRKAQQDADAALEAMDAKAAARLDEARHRFDQMLESLTAESQERGQWIKAALADLTGPRIDHLRSLLDQAAVQTDTASESSLAGAVARAESLRAGVETNLVQIEELSKQVALMRDLLARSILEGVGRIDDLDARQEELLASASRAIEQYAGEIDSLRASMTVQAIEAAHLDGTPAAATAGTGDQAAPSEDVPPATSADLAAATAELAAAQERLDALRRQTDEATQAAEWLTTLIDRAARAGIAIDQSLEK